MIVLYEHPIGQIEAMIGTAANPNRIFFENPQAGSGLSGIGDAHGISLDVGNKAGGQGGDARQTLQEIEGHPFGLEKIDNRTAAPSTVWCSAWCESPSASGSTLCQSPDSAP